jgi:hypothetical protein
MFHVISTPCSVASCGGGAEDDDTLSWMIRGGHTQVEWVGEREAYRGLRQDLARGLQC